MPVSAAGCHRVAPESHRVVLLSRRTGRLLLPHLESHQLPATLLHGQIDPPGYRDDFDAP